MKILANISVVVFHGGSEPKVSDLSMRHPGLSPVSCCSSEAAMTSSYYHKNVLLEGKSPDKSLASRFVSPSKVSPEKGIKPIESFRNGLGSPTSRLSEESRNRHGSSSSFLSSSSSSSSLSFTKPIYSSRSRTELDIKRSSSRILEPEDLKQIGSLESSPKWARIKEAFEGPESESNLSKTFSRSTSSLPRPLARQLAASVVKRTESCDRGSQYRPKVNAALRTQDDSDKKKVVVPSPRITLDFLPDRRDSKSTSSHEISDTRQRRLKTDYDLSRHIDSETRSKKSSLCEDRSVSNISNLRSLDVDSDILPPRKTRYSDVDRVLTKTYSRELYDSKLSRMKSYRSEHSDTEAVIGSRNCLDSKRSALQSARDSRVTRQRGFNSDSDSEVILTRKALPDMESIQSLKSYLKEIQDSKLKRQRYLRTDSLSKSSLSLNVSITTDRESRRSRTKLSDNSEVDLVSRYSRSGSDVTTRLKDSSDFDGKVPRVGRSGAEEKLPVLDIPDSDTKVTKLSRSEINAKMLLLDSSVSKVTRLGRTENQAKMSEFDTPYSDVKVTRLVRSESEAKSTILDNSDSDLKVTKHGRYTTNTKSNILKESDTDIKISRRCRSAGNESQSFIAEKESFLDWETKATQLYLQKLEETKASRLKIKKKLESEASTISEPVQKTGTNNSSTQETKLIKEPQGSLRSIEPFNNIKTAVVDNSSISEKFLRLPRADTKPSSGITTRPKSAVSPLNEEPLSLGKLERGISFHGTMTSPKGGIKGWKMTSTGSWIKVHVEKEVFCSTIKSKVALLTHQFDHLRSSAGESMAKDLVVFKNGDHSPMKPKVGCQSLDAICCPMFLSTKAVEESEAATKKQKSPEKVITRENRKLGLVKQVVQNFEEVAQKSCSSSESETSPTSAKAESGNLEKVSINGSNEGDCEKSKKPHIGSPKQQRPTILNDTKQHRCTDEKDEKTYSTFAHKSKLPVHCKLTIPPRLSSRNGSSPQVKTLNHRPSVPPPRKPSSADSPKSGNSTDGEGSLLAELEKWLVQKYDQKEPTGRQPNESFLWKKLGPQLSSESEDSARKSSESGGDEPCPPLGYYSSPFAHPSIGSDGEEHIYMEASFVRPPTELPIQRSPCDSDEGWVDVDEAELEHFIKESNDSNSEILIRSRPKNLKAHCVRRSWVQSVRENTCNTKEWTQKDYQDITVWETEEGDASSSSSTTSDHLYEALYDVIMPDDRAEPNQNIPIDNLASASMDTGINETMSSGTLEESSERTPEILSEPEPKLKRNWSLTKSDIRLEMSKSNKMKVQNDSSSDAMEPQSDTEVVTSKKKTLIKFILRQKNNAPAKKRTHKKGATFYVRWSKVDRETRECNNKTEQQKDELDGATGCSEIEGGKRFATVRRRPSNPIRRPTTPPPLPPIAGGQVRSHEGTKSLEVLRPTIPNGMTAEEKAKSLDSSQILKLESGDGDTLRRSYSSSQESCSPSSSSQSSHDTPNGNVFFLRPKSRGSVASSLSSHSGSSYIHEDEVASIPKPNSLSLPTTREEEACYLQLRKEQSEALRSPFEEEPLYQFYQKRVKQRATKLQTFLTMDEEQEEKKGSENLNLSPVSVSSTSSGIPSAMELLHHDIGNQRTLWCEVPEVRSSGILEQVTMQDRKLQEAMFEVITSEASYLKSLNVLIEHFMECPEFSDDFSLNCVLGRRERHVLFSDVIPVREVSIRLLTDLEQRWQENILISNICDILYEHASKFFSVYVKYCANQVYQDRILKEMKATRPDFISVLQRLESNPMCQGLDMLSFLMLPMQRITRMPLLVDAIFHRLTTESPYYDICKLTLVTLNKVVAECNEAARKMERMEEMLVISRQLDFKDCKSIPLISASRWLVKKGELVRLVCENPGRNRTFGRSARYTRVPLYLFLFTDLLLVSRKKSDDAYVVLDYCPRNLVQVFNLEEAGLPMPGKLPDSHRNVFQLTMLQNHEFKTVEHILGCPLESDRTRWMEAVTPPVAENPEEKIYEEWDCPQVQCIYPYFAKQPDELTLEESDVVNVFRKMPDGWHEGERLRDGVKGWFPASFTVEIISSHIRARNLRQRYRLLMLSQAYVEEQRKAFLLDKLDKSK